MYNSIQERLEAAVSADAAYGRRYDGQSRTSLGELVVYYAEVYGTDSEEYRAAMFRYDMECWEAAT